MSKIFILPFLFLLTGCLSLGQNFSVPETPKAWTGYQADIIEEAEVQNLKNWWQQFDDPALNELILLAFKNSPDQNIAKARILEARGIRLSTRALLFPEVDVSGTAGRQDDGQDIDNFYEAGFDASYEIDVFGANRNASRAANFAVRALEASYHNVTLTFIAEISRDYIDFRAAQKQANIARKNLEIQEKTLDLVRKQKEFGEAPQLDVERAENLVNTTKSSIPEFKRLADNARFRLSVLTGSLPEKLIPVLRKKADIPGSDVKPVLSAPAKVIALRPDIRAAGYTLSAATSLAESATADIFPTFTLSGFFNIVDNSLLNGTSVWNVALGAAVNLIDFGRIRGRIDAARAVELEAYETYRKTILEAVSEVETALSDYAHINEQHAHLFNAFVNAKEALELSQLLYKEGEVSFINVLEAQRTLNESDSALISVQAARSQSLVRLYKSLGVY